MSLRPFCNGTQLVINPDRHLLGTELQAAKRAFFIGVAYLTIGSIGIVVNVFVLSVFVRKPLRTESAYKLLCITTVLDIVNIITASIVCGVFSFKNASYCTPGQDWFFSYGPYYQAHWYAYCAASEALALNRVLIFVKPNIAKFLFYGKRAWFWVFYVVGYAVFGTVIRPSTFYAYDPAFGAFFDGEENTFHIVNNFVKLCCVLPCYLIILVVFLSKAQKSSQCAQRSITIQTFLVAVLASTATVGYLGVSYLPSGNPVAAYSGLIGQLGWILLHTLSGFIYLFGNRTVRYRFLEMFVGKKVFTVTSRSRKLVNK